MGIPLPAALKNAVDLLMQKDRNDYKTIGKGFGIQSGKGAVIMGKICGMDVSYAQGSINWEQVKASKKSNLQFCGQATEEKSLK